MAELPIAPIGRIIKNAGAVRVSRNADIIKKLLLRKIINLSMVIEIVLFYLILANSNGNIYLYSL